MTGCVETSATTLAGQPWVDEMVDRNQAPPSFFLFSGSPIHRGKDGTYVTRATRCFVLATYPIPPCVTVISLAVTLAFGGRSLFVEVKGFSSPTIASLVIYN